MPRHVGAAEGRGVPPSVQDGDGIVSLIKAKDVLLIVLLLADR